MNEERSMSTVNDWLNQINKDSNVHTSSNLLSKAPLNLYTTAYTEILQDSRRRLLLQSILIYINDIIFSVNALLQVFCRSAVYANDPLPLSAFSLGNKETESTNRTKSLVCKTSRTRYTITT